MITSDLYHQPAPPFYECIKDTLREGILSGHHVPAPLLPPEAAPGEQFNASRTTARQALAGLQDKGLISRHYGKGTFMSQPKTFQNTAASQGFAEAVSVQGHAIHNRVLRLRTLPAPVDVAQALQLVPGTAVMELHRVWLLDQVPIFLEVMWLPEPLDSSVARADFVTHGVLLVLEQDAGVALGHTTLAVDAMPADHTTATIFETGASTVLLRVEHLMHDTQGTLIDFEHLCFRGDAFQYRPRLDRQVAAHARSILPSQGTK